MEDPTYVVPEFGRTVDDLSNNIRRLTNYQIPYAEIANVYKQRACHRLKHARVNGYRTHYYKAQARMGAIELAYLAFQDKKPSAVLKNTSSGGSPTQSCTQPRPTLSPF
jgi:hypothetical protein